MNTRDTLHRGRARGNAPTLRAGLLGGMLGAATCLGALSVSRVTGPSQALASQGVADERPRGLLSAADQRIEIIERLDRLNATLDAMRRLMEQQAQQTHGAPARRP